MAIELNEQEQERLYVFIDLLLELYDKGELPRDEAIQSIGNTILTAGIDDRPYLEHLINSPGVIARWLPEE